jgi:hypothetical protein
MTDQAQPFEGWAIVELMGHRRLAGHVGEQEIAGSAFLRLDVPAATGEGVTQFYSPSAVYCITPTTEDIARKVAAKYVPAPVSRFELGSPRPDPWTDGDAAIDAGIHEPGCVDPDCVSCEADG